MSVLIIIPAWNSYATTTGPCLESLLRFHQVDSRILCIDNASQDETPWRLEEICAREDSVSWVRLEKNLGWAGASLYGLDQKREEEDFCLLNSDTLVSPGWLGKLRDHLRSRPHVSMIIPHEPEGAEKERLGPNPSADAMAELESQRKNSHQGQCVPCPPIGFCVLVRSQFRPEISEYLAHFHDFQSRTRDWQEFFKSKNLFCQRALDTVVYHQREGSGGYENYRRQKKNENHIGSDSRASRSRKN